MSDDERRGFDNLLLLCFAHAEEIDLKDFIDRYSVDLLDAWKKQQVEAGTTSGTPLPDHLVDRAIELGGFIADFRNATIDMRGEGGQAPGAGGGGGGAIGPGARGGDGGQGGDQAIITVTGAEAMGEVPIVVGKGARPGVVGMPGECGGHTRFGTFVVHGAGRETHEIRSAEIAGIADTTIVAALFANYGEIQNGLAYLAGAGWGWYGVKELPGPLTAGLGVWVDVALDDWDPEAALPIEVIVELFTPTDHVTLSQKARLEFRADRNDGFVRFAVPISLRGTLHDVGVHTVHISCNDLAHVDFPLDIRLDPPGEPAM